MSSELKNIQHAIRNVQATGNQIGDIEALLIHDDDYYKLLQFFRDNQDDSTSRMIVDLPCRSGELRMFGIKIIRSQYVKPGSVYKIFKNDGQFCLNTPGLGMQPSTTAVAGSGIIPTPMTDEQWVIPPTTEKQSTMHRMNVRNMPEKKEKPDKNRHSTKRKIELD